MVGQLHPRLTTPVAEKPLDTKGFDRPRALLERIDEDLTPLLDLALRPVISARQFNRRQLIQLSRLAARFETQPQLLSRPLTGTVHKRLYEPSTRTRLPSRAPGIGLAAMYVDHRPGLHRHRESLYDIGEMLNHYGDLVVLSNDRQAVYDMPNR